MPIPSPADFRNKTKKHSEVREMLAQMAENVATKEIINQALADFDSISSETIKQTSTSVTNLLSAIQLLVLTVNELDADSKDEIQKLMVLNAENHTAVSHLFTGIQALVTAVGATNDRLDRTNEASEQQKIVLLQSIMEIVNAVATLELPLRELIDSSEYNNSRFLVALNHIVEAVTELTNQHAELKNTVNNHAISFNTAFQHITNAINDHEMDIASLIKQVVSLNFLSTNLVNAIAEVLRQDPFDESVKLKKLIDQQSLTIELSKLDGFDTETTKTVDISEVITFQKPTSVVRIDVTHTGSLPTAKGTVIHTQTRLKVDGQAFNCYGTLEVQGSSSAAFPKKNWTLGFFKDAERTEAVAIKLGDMMAHDELVFKSNFVDNTNCRNLTVNRLWHQMCEARNDWPKFEPDLFNIRSGVGLDSMPTGATGHVDGYPAVIYINERFYGIGSLNIGKKRINYNLKSNDQNHIQLDPNGNLQLHALPVNPLDPPSVGSSIPEAFEIRRPSSWGAVAQTNYLRLRDFLSKTQSEMQALGIDNYINRTNMIDYIILCQVCDLWDHLHKNTLYTTLDGSVWSFMPYDVDTVFGLHFTGVYFDSDGATELHPASVLRIPSVGAQSNWGTLAKFRNIYGSAIDDRYKQLRDHNIISVENILGICEQLVRTYPIELFKAENTRWNLVPGGTIYQTLQQTGSLNQIKTWLEARIPLCDSYFNY